MIKLHTNQVDKDGMRLSGREKPSEFFNEGDISSFSIQGDVSYDLCAMLVSGGILVSGTIEILFKCQCGRCLEYYNFTVKDGGICHFYDIGSKTEIDLTPDLREDAIMALPQNFICGEGCRGLCPVCGCNRNLTTCNCETEKERNNCWKELDKLAMKPVGKKTKHASAVAATRKG